MTSLRHTGAAAMILAAVAFSCRAAWAGTASTSVSTPTVNILESYGPGKTAIRADRGYPGIAKDAVTGQTFRHAKPFSISAITFRITNGPWSYGSGTHLLDLRITKDTNGDNAPDIQVFGDTFNVASVTLTGGSFLTLTFSTPTPTLEPNTAYGMELYWTTSDSAHCVQLTRSNGGNGYPNGGSLFVSTDPPPIAFPTFSKTINATTDVNFWIQGQEAQGNPNDEMRIVGEAVDLPQAYTRRNDRETPNPALAFHLTLATTGEVALDGTTVTVAGDGNVDADITEVAIYRDANGDGQIDDGTRLGDAKPIAGKAYVSFASPLTLAYPSTLTLVLTVSFAPSAAGKSFTVSTAQADWRVDESLGGAGDFATLTGQISGVIANVKPSFSVVENFTNTGGNRIIVGAPRGAETIQVPDSSDSGFGWGGYHNGAAGTTGTIRLRDQDIEFERYGANSTGSYVYTVFDSKNRKPPMSDYFARGFDFGAIRVSIRDASSAGQSIRFLARDASGDWYLSNAVAVARQKVFEFPVSTLAWQAVVNDDDMSQLDSDAQNAALVTTTGSPDLSLVSGGGVYMETGGTDKPFRVYFLSYRGTESAGNDLPLVDAGPTQKVTLEPCGTAQVQLNGAVTDPDGMPTTGCWRLEHAPFGGSVIFADNTDLKTTATIAGPDGNYVLKLTGSDGTYNVDGYVAIGALPVPPAALIESWRRY